MLDTKNANSPRVLDTIFRKQVRESKHARLVLYGDFLDIVIVIVIIDHIGAILGDQQILIVRLAAAAGLPGAVALDSFGTCGWEVVGRTWTRRQSIPYRGVVRREGSGLQLEELHVWFSARKADSDPVKGRDIASARQREAAPAGWTPSRRRLGSAAGNSGQPL